MLTPINEITKPYSKKALLILIPLVGIFICIVFISSGKRMISDSLFAHAAYAITVSGGLWLGCLIIVEYLWKKYPWEHKPIKHLLVEVIAILTYTIVYSGFLYKISVYAGFHKPIKTNYVTEVFTTVLITFFITTLHEAVFFYKQWKYNFSKSVQLQNQQLTARFDSLKSQINPHYIFNSLNNLVSIVDDNPLAVEYINQMSTYLRYTIKSREEELVLLDEELQMLNKYIYLNKIRFGDILSVNISIEEKLKTSKVPPMVLQMLIENCIKHNVIAKNKPLTIEVNSDNNCISVQNNRNPKNNVESTGQGLSNIKERYTYFTTEEVIVEESDDSFKVIVPIIV